MALENLDPSTHGLSKMIKCFCCSPFIELWKMLMTTTQRVCMKGLFEMLSGHSKISKPFCETLLLYWLFFWFICLFYLGLLIEHQWGPQMVWYKNCVCSLNPQTVTILKLIGIFPDIVRTCRGGLKGECGLQVQESHCVLGQRKAYQQSRYWDLWFLWNPWDCWARCCSWAGCLYFAGAFSTLFPLKGFFPIGVAILSRAMMPCTMFSRDYVTKQSHYTLCISEKCSIC